MSSRHSIFAAVLILLSLTIAETLASAGRYAMESGPNRPIDSTMPDQVLIGLLKSGDGVARAKATAEVFRRGASIVPALERAGAKPIATIAPPRLDVIYSLLKRELPGHYRSDSFGLHFGEAVTREAVVRMGRKHGFVLESDELVQPGASPACYVLLTPGKTLVTVLRRVLQEEPNVITVNLNYTES